MTIVRELISPSLRFELREKTAWLRDQFSRAWLFNWEVTMLPRPAGSLHEVVYLGRKAQRDMVNALLTGDRDAGIGAIETHGPGRRAIISEIPFPGTLCVPLLLSSIVPLGRTIEEITRNYHSQLRRELRRDRPRYCLQQVLDIAEIERVDREMLRPYAIARHGAGAAQIPLAEVKRMALKYGRLDLLLLEDRVVGCQLGHVITRAGKRYWSVNRFGYPEAVYSDYKRLRDTNSMNNHLAMEWAIANGFDYYDIGVALAQPGDGLLEWKRRRGGELDTLGNISCFHVRLPGVGTAQFLHDTPLFAIERGKLALHLGLPDGLSEIELASRYREMGYGGLSRVYLHCARPPGEQFLGTLHEYFAHQKSPPEIKIISSV